MPKKRFSAEQIVTLLRQIEVSMSQGKPTPKQSKLSRHTGRVLICSNLEMELDPA
jgi:hypothetical protein